MLERQGKHASIRTFECYAIAVSSKTCSSTSPAASRAATKMLPKIEGLLGCEAAAVWCCTWCTKLLGSVVRGSTVNTSPPAAAAHAASTNKLPVHRGARAAGSFMMVEAEAWGKRKQGNGHVPTSRNATWHHAIALYELLPQLCLCT
eukprot:10166-Heterococcus_DN1.PRE.1